MLEKSKKEVLLELLKVLLDKKEVKVTNNPFIKSGEIMVSLCPDDFDSLKLIRGTEQC